MKEGGFSSLNQWETWESGGHGHVVTSVNILYMFDFMELLGSFEEICSLHMINGAEEFPWCLYQGEWGK